MKKYIITLMLSAFAYCCDAQSYYPLVRHDTTVLKIAECQWIIKSLAKNNPSLKPSAGKSVTKLILEAIEKNKLRAVDPFTGVVIPAKSILTWKMGDVTTEKTNAAGVQKAVAIKQKLNPDSITKIRIYHDWYFDISRSKFRSR